MKLPRIKVNDKAAFEKQLNCWLLMRDAIGEGTWESLAPYLGVDQYTHGPKRIRKKRTRKYILRMMMQDLAKAGKFDMYNGRS